jgi:para-nitrobenzyl esterase
MNESTSPSAAPLAQTRQGMISGYWDDDVAVFKGVPFATPPTGDLRFKRAQPPQPHDGTLVCVEPGPAAPQSSDHASLRYRAAEKKSEDCLYLNVWSKAQPGDKKPVIVFLHGGGYQSGSGAVPLYDGKGFADRDAVFVTTNYRLGLFGFMHLADFFDGYEESGNNGLLDVVSALEWIRDNIDSFGGDPDNVTLFGSSAGGVSIGALMVMPAAKGLFHRGAPVSSTPTSHRSLESAREATQRFLDYVHVTPGDTEALLALTTEQLTIVPASSSIPDRNAVKGPESDMLEYVLATGAKPTGPLVDGVVLPESELDLVKAGKSAGIDLMLGTTSEESRGSFWKLAAATVDPDLAAMASSVQPETLDYMSLFEGVEVDKDTVESVYGEALTAAGREVTDRDIYAQIKSDGMFTASASYAAAHSSHNPNTFMFRFTWRSPANGGIVGAFHGVPTPFWFDRLGQPGWETVMGDNPPHELAKAMQAALVAFATTGNPTTPALPTWERYDADERMTMVLNVESHLESNPAGAQRELVELLLA